MWRMIFGRKTFVNTGVLIGHWGILVGPYCANLVSQMHITMIGGMINKVSLAFIAGSVACEPFGNSENLVYTCILSLGWGALVEQAVWKLSFLSKFFVSPYIIHKNRENMVFKPFPFAQVPQEQRFFFQNCKDFWSQWHFRLGDLRGCESWNLLSLGRFFLLHEVLLFKNWMTVTWWYDVCFLEQGFILERCWYGESCALQVLLICVATAPGMQHSWLMANISWELAVG